MSPAKLRRKELREAKFNRNSQIETISINNYGKKPSPLQLEDLQPKTLAQARTIKEWENGNELVMHGCPGTGKSYIAMWLALDAVERGEQKKVMVIRSATSSKDLGALPGSASDKVSVYEAPYVDICSDLYGRRDAWSVLKTKKIVEFESTSYMRGRTLRDTVIVLDEIQNAQDSELHLILSRVGDNSRIILCGDMKQSDHIKNGTSGAPTAMKILSRMSNVSSVEFGVQDICRSGFVKNYILAREAYKD